MQTRLEKNGTTYLADLSAPTDLSIPVSANGITAWGVPGATLEPHGQPGFTGSVATGASVNFYDITFNPHAHGTHTECMGHITERPYSVNTIPPAPWMEARLVSIEPEPAGKGAHVSLGQLREALGTPSCEAVVIRTYPNPPSKRGRSWSGSNPPYLDPKASAWLAAEGVLHLLIDLPSVDPEEDGGALAAHTAFWGLPGNPRPAATITELIFVPDSLADGRYLLNLQVAAIENDASPSRPLLFKLKEL
ncbi:MULTISPECIES: cyclase family protein [Robiginitalea]|uniref:cyclase family protein n=1 Tax=Robiginitalea TaxID=252306 RepID=UPI00234ADE78|nr:MULTISPECIES: cyclase family protein [unclassified Robiginitalea]MDC6354350.1 cyclase family protein [Robiginitalea sp. PM2]MDC6374968.1 cyclase family protein [Robiginitalea sp. SP8]